MTIHRARTAASAGPGGQTDRISAAGPTVEGLFDLRADNDIHGLPELVGHLDHVHEAGVHAEEVDLPAEGAQIGKDNPQLAVVQGVAAGGVVMADAAVFLGGGAVNVFLRDGLPEKAPARFLRCGMAAPALGILPPATAVVPEDEGVPVGRVVVRRPLDEIIEDLRVAGVGVAETFDTVFLETAALGDPETTGGIVLDPVELGQNVDVPRGSSGPSPRCPGGPLRRGCCPRPCRP